MSKCPERTTAAAALAAILALGPAGNVAAQEDAAAAPSGTGTAGGAGQTGGPGALPLDPAAFDPEAFGDGGIGHTPSAEEVAAWDIDVRYDGDGAPEGRGTVLDGEDVFVMQCAFCHGDFGEGAGRWPALAGGTGTLGHEHPVKTVGSYWPYAGTLVDYIYRSMPFGYGQSLSPDDLYAVSAYVLYLNDVVTDENFELSHENLGEIVMPNADGFIPDNREEVEAHFWQDEPCMTDCGEGEAEITMRAVVLDVTPDGDAGEGQPILD